MKPTTLVLWIVLALALWACGTSDGSAVQTSPDGAQLIALQAADIRYSLTTLEVKAGQPVQMSFENMGALEHDFSVAEIPVTDVHAEGDSGGHGHGAAEADLHLLLAPGTSGMLEFTPTSPGTYGFQCTVPGHAGAGMMGELIVR